MELRITRFCVKYTLVFGIVSFLFAALIFFLQKNGVIHKQPVENPDLSQGLSYAISVVLFVLYLVTQMVMSFCTALFGAVGISAIKKNKNLKVFLIVISIAESVFAAVNVFSTITVFDFGFVVGGVFSLLCALGSVACVVVCILSVREIVTSFTNCIMHN